MLINHELYSQNYSHSSSLVISSAKSRGIGKLALFIRIANCLCIMLDVLFFVPFTSRTRYRGGVNVACNWTSSTFRRTCLCAWPCAFGYNGHPGSNPGHPGFLRLQRTSWFESRTSRFFAPDMSFFLNQQTLLPQQIKFFNLPKKF